METEIKHRTEFDASGEGLVPVGRKGSCAASRSRKAEPRERSRGGRLTGPWASSIVSQVGRPPGGPRIVEIEGVGEMLNGLKTTVLLAVLTVLFMLLGGMLGGEQGMVVAFVFAG